ncbi:putative death-receptor fusion protein-domain-containing protein [Cokeromyces recurvatus]|uniref:putative death-receptor fusion protein-domain-containing protein n=1 Tax=Cokeromyces recurvatus TaxID=90255 RepID=UPI00221F28B7|nr:putative death-receptor fusion protein-domain-containing protein [Cokeromyces recurvatus]KAI7907871.1 putative death-receptor fusion protein-domain-containing protein [Cokeromyces recurvatus]
MSTTDKNLTDNHSTATSESHDDETMSHSSEENEAEEEKETSEKDEEMKQEAKTNVEVKDEDKESNKEKTITSDPFTKFGGNGKEDDWGEFAEDDNSQQKTKVDVKTKDTESENGKSKYTFGASSGFGSKGWAAANQTVPISSKPLFGGFGNTSSFGFKSLGSTTTTTTTTTTNAFTSTNDNLSDKKTSTPSWGSFVNATASPFAAIAASAGNALASSPADKSDSTSKNANITVSNMNTNTEKQTELDGEKDETSASISTFGEGPKVKVPGIKQQTKVKTGEEDEDTVYQTRAKLFTLDTASGNWKERGVGIFRINVKDEDEEKGMQARLVMRTDSVYRLILNLLLFEGMKVFIMQDKFVRFAGFESETKEDVFTLFLYKLKMEKARKGVKPIKFPKPLFASWKNIIDEYTTTHANIKLISVVTVLQKLITLEDATYDRQAACIKEAVKLMQMHVNSIEKLQPVELEQIKTLVEPIASLGYFAACENLSRRAFIPLIEASIKCSGESKDIQFRHYYMQYTTIDAESLFNKKSLAEKALTIYATLKFPLGHDMIVETYQHTLQFLVSGLEDAQRQIKSETAAVNLSNTNQLMNDIQFTIKTLLVLFSRQLQVAIDLFSRLESNENQEDDADIILLSRAMRMLLNICVDTSTFIKECNQVAGMAIGAIINLANSPEFARDWVLGWFFTKKEFVTSAAVEQMSRIFDVSCPYEKLTSLESWNSRDAPIIFILRGLVSSLRKEIVTLDLPSQIVLNPAIEKFLAKNIHEILFICINLFCGRADLDASCKVIAFESMATWLQQTKEMMEKYNTKELMDAVSGPIESNNMNILIQYVWDHWDDPIDSIQHKVRAIFELSLSTLQIKTTFYQQDMVYSQFIDTLLKNLLAMDWHRKVKYSLLNMLVEKVHTDAFLKAEPQLMQKCMLAMDSFILCPQITYFILAFLYRRIQDTIPHHKDFKGHNGKIKDSDDTAVKMAIQAWIHLWAPSLLHCLTASSELLRKNMSGFLLQPLFKVAPQSFWYIVYAFQDLEHPLWTQPKENLEINPDLKLNAFIAVLKAGRGLDIVDGTTYTTKTVPEIDQKKISIETLKLAIYHSDDQVRLDVLGLICESRKATAQVTTTELDLLKLFIPLNMNSTAPEFRQQMCAHLSKILTRLRGNLYSQYRNYKSLLIYADKNTGIKRENALLDAQDILVEIDQAKSFLHWICDHIAESLYPGASYQRVATTLRILSIVIKIFGVTELPSIEGFTDEQPDFPFKVPIATPRLSKLLVDVLMNPYDFNRVQAFDILCQFPSPLPGIETKSDVQDLLWWGLNNVISTRAGESDSGAMIFRLIFTKYVIRLGFDLSPEQHATPVTNNTKAMVNTTAAIVFTERLLDLLEKQVNIAKSNLLLAAQQHPMHGTLLALQYVFQELDYNSSSTIKYLPAWRKTHARTISLIHITCNTVMPVLSDASPEGNVPTDYRENEAEDEDEDEDAIDMSDDSTTGPKHQVILSCCWRAVKEASSLLQAIISKAPVSPTTEDDTILTYKDLVESGTLFRQLLTSIRHRGAFSAVYPAYVSLNTRLLTSCDPAIAQLPSQWLQENLDSLISSNISITRRSAGLPLCILAIVSSEPSVKKELLAKTMKYLMKLAHDEPPIDADQRIDLPQVHAYNIMRTIFMDSKLGTHVLEYVSSGFSLAINGFSSHSWAIRNCAVMLFSTLLQRTFGTKKTRDEHSREFFIRFSDLHPYLLKELSTAVDQLLKNSLAASVHPGLYPILTLLSRMQPSTETINEKKETVLTPFIPLVMPCAASAIYKTREMAARALVPLVLDVVTVIKQLMEFPEQITQNEIHGRLLQVQFLLRGHFYSENSPYTEFINDMPSIMIHMLDLVYEKKFCNINSALLLNIIGEFFFDTKWITEGGKDKEVITELMELTKNKFADIRKRTKKYCLDAIKDDQILGIGSYLVRESMANIIVMSTLYKPNAKIDDIMFLLVDRDYEVRFLVLQKLLNYFETISEYPSTKQLQSLLVERTYYGEDSLNCYVLTVKLLMVIKSTDPYPTDIKMSFTLKQYWDRLVAQFTEKRALSITESVLPLLSALLSQILRNSSSDTNWIQQCLVIWSSYIEKYSRKDITLPLREAVVKSLHFISEQIFAANNTFEIQNVENARIIAALAITQLLQDDDVDVRNDIAAIVSRALHLQAPVHHDRALEIVHRYLTTQFSTSKSLESILMTRLTDNSNILKGSIC